MKTLALISLILASAPFAFGQFDAPGTVKSISKVRGDGTMVTTIVNPDKHTTEEIISDTSGKITKKTVFIYDENNVQLGTVYYDGKGVIRYKERYTMDPSNRVSESAIFTATDQPLGRRVFIYDAKGKPRVEDYDVSGKLMPQAINTNAGKRPNNAPPSAPTVRRAIPVR